MTKRLTSLTLLSYIISAQIQQAQCFEISCFTLANLYIYKIILIHPSVSFVLPKLPSKIALKSLNRHYAIYCLVCLPTSLPGVSLSLIFCMALLSSTCPPLWSYSAPLWWPVPDPTPVPVPDPTPLPVPDPVPVPVPWLPYPPAPASKHTMDEPTQ